MAIVQIPKYCFHQTVREVVCVRDVEDTVPCQRTNAEDEALLNVELDRFLETLTPEEQTVVQMKLDGYTSREIIPVVKAKGEPQMSHLLSKIRKKARAFFKRE